ncbi:MAG: PAS domain-containing protein [Actinomycetota bacterium]
MSEEHNLVHILARGLASSVATPMFLVDPGGTLVYYNEPAEEILGQTYAEAGELSAEEWSGAMFSPEDPDTGEPFASEDMPLSVALAERKPAHRFMRIVGLDGVKRRIGVTAFPLFARSDEFVGAVAIFWEEKE